MTIKFNFEVDPNTYDCFINITEDAMDAIVVMRMRQILQDNYSQKCDNLTDIDHYLDLESAAATVIRHFSVPE